MMCFELRSYFVEYFNAFALVDMLCTFSAIKFSIRGAMTTITFDTHNFVKKLKAIGFTEEQAEVFASEQARLIEDKLATKNDLVELENNLHRDMRELEYRIIIKLGGLMVASIAVVTTLVKLL